MIKRMKMALPACIVGTTSLALHAETLPQNVNNRSIDSVVITKSESVPSQGILSKTVESLDSRLSKHLNLSGYILGRAQYSSDKNNYGGFDVRMLRVIMNGDINQDFSYRVQMEMAGGPRILDAWGEWKKYKFFKIRAGQQKRNFTFENPWSPLTLGVPDYSQVIMKLTGFNDRVGEHSCGGRDAGIVIMGDFVNTTTHPLFNYSVGVFNGNGINKMDNNKSKDIIGSLHMRPFKNLYFGGAYWLGKYGEQANKVDRNRWTVGFKYDDNKYLLRGEYISSKGKKYLNEESTNNADGWYLTAGAPVAKKLKAFVKYDVYRDEKNYHSQTTKYVAAINWFVHPFITLQGSYTYLDTKIVNSNDSHNAAVQMFVRF